MAVAVLFVLIAVNAGAQNAYFYGLTSDGSGGDGSVFRTDTTGKNLEIVDSFYSVKNGKVPFTQTLLEVNSKLYGVITNGGNNNKGVLFEYNPVNNNYIVKHHFTDSTGTNPAGILLKATNGNIYGTTLSGGTGGHGTIFEYNLTTQVLKTVVSFNGPSMGSAPRGKMVETGGKIYGICENYAANSSGAIYEFDISSKSITKIAALKSSTTGGSPQGGLMLASSGKIYGMTTNGGAKGNGTLFEYTISSNTVVAVHDFKGTDGATGTASLIQASNGKIWGTTRYGGGVNKGSLFEYDIALDTLKIKSGFGSNSTGYYPGGELLETATDKYLLLLTTGGVNNFSGTIAEYNSAANTLTKKVDFNRISLGASPDGTLVKASINGKYYGLCGYGGSSDGGVLFEYDLTNNILTKKIDLSEAPMGKTPSNTLLLATNGKLYGTCNIGGLGYGTLFEVNPSTGKIKKLADFNGTNGKNPVGQLVQAANGKLYGNTIYGGSTNDFGVVFEYDIVSNTLTKLKDYSSTTGIYPRAGFLLANNGKLYATTTSGGVPNYGTIVEYDIANNTLVLKDNFDNSTTGYSAYSKLIQTSDGKIYGTAVEGGANNKGTIFEFNLTTGKLTGLAHFNQTNGAAPRSSMVEASNGKLYGIASQGNTSGFSNGVVYEFDVANTNIIAKKSFDRLVHGYGGNAAFIQGKNGKLYATSSFGTNQGAKVLEYNIVKDSFNAITSLNASGTGSLVQVNGLFGVGVNSIEKALNVSVYPNPAKGAIHLEFAETETHATVELLNLCGQKVIQATVQGNTGQISLEGLKTGVYIIRIQANGKLAVQQIVVQ
ncbi:MAG: T9SS type A sorting domain-containing protein [Bacteroidia bacterium]|nr:T9SS type A sorting domain-containing protein [Bacteroidia bacterium]